MANKRLDMTTLRQLIRLKSEGRSHRYISSSLGISRTTVVEYVKQLSFSGLSWPALLQLNDEGLEIALQGSGAGNERHKNLLAFFPYMEEELKKTGVTRQLLWQEYKQDQPDAYGYSQFCYYYQLWSKSTHPTAPLLHKAGEKLYVDFTGQLLEVIDSKTAEISKVQVFVGVLAASGYTYVKACHSQKQQDFIDCLSSCLNYFTGVPALIIPDNLKSAVVKSSRYEPEITLAMKQFALHYNTVILPTRSYKPKDKAAVENAVSNVYRSFFAPLRNQQFFSLQQLNEALAQQLELFNNRKYQHRDYSRRELFEKTEQQVLGPLPLESFSLKKQLRLQVQKNGHIWLSEDKHYYSVPYKYIGQRVQVFYTSSQVEIYANHERIAFHLRNRKGYGYSTEKSHLSSSYRFVSEWNPERFKSWAKTIGEETEEFIDKLFEVKPHPEQAYKSAMGILSLAKKAGNERLNNACKRALHFESYYYNTVKKILEKGLDQAELTPSHSILPEHENLRGSSYYE
ncbi:IS21 family transposase [Cesiribacter sp. SM1]|uniref:IS21 family transposase n=1 Tax=Cesiribacter sp. SM1 TaxID=2861196 RepID=UPI001CD1A94B|nr:IS21 family transposase [Cesiribacter sp. SM1]